MYVSLLYLEGRESEGPVLPINCMGRYALSQDRSAKSWGGENKWDPDTLVGDSDIGGP